MSKTKKSNNSLLMPGMNHRQYIPYIIAILSAGFACTQDVAMEAIDWLAVLTMRLNYGWFTIIVMALLALWSVYLLWRNWQKCHYGHTLTAMLVFFVVTTGYFRFLSEVYQFVPLAGRIVYVDVLWVLAIAFLGEAIINKLAKKKLEENVEDTSILLDAPIEAPSEDDFDYYSEALHIGRTLARLPQNRAVSVAVLAPWGNGKTSFVNLIKYAIRYGDNKKPLFDHVIIEFNPRQSKKMDAIQEDFFKALIEALPDEANTRNKISDYLENIGIQEIHPLLRVFAGLMKSTRNDVTNAVNEALDRLGKRLIVIIDDFDRLTAREIIEVLKLIDKNAAFRHTVFITAYDDTAVTNALREYESKKGIAYIDKFFTLRFQLPLRSENGIVNSLYRKLQDKVGADIELLPIMNQQYWIVAECVRNLRDVKNFCNMFLIDYAFNSKQEINFREYFLLELMKFRYYDDYYNLYKRTYIEDRSLFKRADATYTLRREYSRKKHEEEPKVELPRSINILRRLFDEYTKDGDFADFGYKNEKIAYRSVQYVRYFDMYFTNRSYGHVQTEGLDSLYTMKSDEEIGKFYRQCMQMKAQTDIEDFLRYQEWEDIKPKGGLTKAETFKQFVRLVYLYSAVADSNDVYVHSLQLQLIYKENFKEKGYNGMKEQEYHDWLMRCIYEHEDLAYIPIDFLTRTTHTLISPKSDGVDDVSGFILQPDEVKGKNMELLKKYMATQTQYSANLSAVYRLCMDRSDNDRQIIMEKANEAMRKFLREDKSNEYLKEFLIINKNDESYVSVAFKDVFFKQLFPVTEADGDTFAKYVKGALPEGNETRTEILAYLEKYRKAGSNNAGHYYLKPGEEGLSRMEIIERLEF